MEAVDAMQFAKEGMFIFLKISAPVLLVALIVGLSVSLFQALTQIQEQTLSFVPKVFAIFLVLVLVMPYIAGQLEVYAEHLSERIIQQGS